MTIDLASMYFYENALRYVYYQNNHIVAVVCGFFESTSDRWLCGAERILHAQAH